MDEREKLSCAHTGIGIQNKNNSHCQQLQLGLKKDQMTEANSP